MDWQVHSQKGVSTLNLFRTNDLHIVPLIQSFQVDQLNSGESGHDDPQEEDWRSVRVAVVAEVVAEGEEAAVVAVADIQTRQTQMEGYRLMVSVAESFE